MMEIVLNIEVMKKVNTNSEKLWMRGSMGGWGSKGGSGREGVDGWLEVWSGADVDSGGGGDGVLVVVCGGRVVVKR